MVVRLTLPKEVTVNQPQVVDPVFGCRYRFFRTTNAKGEDIQVVDMEVDPGGGVSPHIHHSMEERFTVKSGRAEFLAGREWIGAGPGETVVVPAGTRHAFRNRGEEVAHVVCEAEPASSLEQFLTEVAALSRDGVFTRHGVPKGPSAALRSAVVIDKHQDMVELLFPPLPPRPVQGWLMGPLAKLGRRRGYA